MMLVKSYLAPSSVGGVGLFADQDIAAGEIVFVLDARYDNLISKSEVDSLPEVFKEFVLRHGYEREDYPFIVLCCDNAKYANHSDDPNVGTGNLDGKWDFMHTSIALRDIKRGEEMTENYGLIYTKSKTICQKDAEFF